jgi:hypothetical protein
MADVDMADAPASAPASAPVVKKKGGPAAEGDSKTDGKKRFEVKKVYRIFCNYSGLMFAHRDRSGTQSPCGLGTLLWTTALFAETTSWIYVGVLPSPRPPWHSVLTVNPKASSARPTRHRRRAKSALSHGVFATYVGLLHDKSIRFRPRADSVIARLPFPLHLQMAQGPPGLPA